MIPWLLVVGAAAGVWRLGGGAHAWAAALAVHNAIALTAMGWDKRQSRLARRRAPESVLLSAAALGATPAVLLGASWFRHKTRKRGFRRRLGAIAIVQTALLGLWLWRVGGR
jgi:uncharacterized membrane protein YsdA (DUF1294 family)